MSYSTSGFPSNQPEPNQGWGNDPRSGSQPSADYPSSQSSAGYADRQQGAYPNAADYPQQGAYAQDGYAQQGAVAPGPYATAPQHGFAGQPGAPAQQWGPRAPRPDQDNVFKAIFDFGFTRYATPGVVKILYILGIVVGGIGWFVSGLFWIMIGGAMSALNPYSTGGGTALFAILTWVLGLIPLFFWIIGLRVSLEYALAIVRINQDSKVIREKLDV